MEYGLRDYGIDGQLGTEKTPKGYIQNLIQIIAECKRVLKKTGSMWVNIGDTYAGSWGNYGQRNGMQRTVNETRFPRKGATPSDYRPPMSYASVIPDKSLIGIPERFAIAMTDELGLIRRNTIIWHKPSCMPSSAKDRFTVDFEYLYFFSKSRKYWFETQYEPLCGEIDRRGNKRVSYNIKTKNEWHKPSKNASYLGQDVDTGRIKRCVWRVNTQPYKEAHFAVFPEKLVETPIRACCPENGIVLDPFLGSGTVAVVAKKLRRNYVGIELNGEYIKMAEKRIRETAVNETLDNNIVISAAVCG